MSTPRRILLLGGGGFLGRALSLRLVQQGHEVHVITPGSQHDVAPGVVAHGGGMENIELLRMLLPRISAVVHLASSTTPGLSQITPTLESIGNIGPTLGLIEQLQHNADVPLIYVSSGGSVYGNPGAASATEDTPLRPMSYYAAGKVAIEVFLRCFQQLSRNRVVILRPSNLYGPQQPRYQGFGVIRTMLQHVLDGSTMEIWGDGSVVRDFIYVDDVVSAIQLVLDGAADSGTFNVGSGVGHSLNDLAQLIGEVCGKPLSINYAPSRKIDVERIVLDSGRMQSRYGWRSTTSLESGIAATWKWLSANAD